MALNLGLNKSDSFQTYRTFVPSECVGTNAGITFDPPPKALYFIQGGTTRAMGFQYRNTSGDIVKLGVIGGGGDRSTIVEVGDCVQVLSLLNRNTPGNAASATSSATGLY